ncbi:MAG: 50S ribosomal protein L21e [Candidatus Bathyarchaeia archaeon]
MPLSHGYRRKTRALLRKRVRERGKSSLSRLLYEYKPGDKVVIDIDPSIHKGMPHRRYHGRVGVIVAKRGRSYEVNVTQGEASKLIIVRPEHIKPFT